MGTFRRIIAIVRKIAAVPVFLSGLGRRIRFSSALDPPAARPTRTKRRRRPERPPATNAAGRLSGDAAGGQGIWRCDSAFGGKRARQARGGPSNGVGMHRVGRSRPPRTSGRGVVWRRLAARMFGFRTEESAMKSLASVWSRWVHQVAHNLRRPRRRRRPYHVPTEACLEDRVLLAAVSFTQSSYTFEVPENSATGTEVGTPQLTPGSPAAYFYIASGNSTDPFVIDPITGVITVYDPSIDYETTSQYTLTVGALDPVTNTYDTATVTVNVQNVDEDPVFANQNYNFNIAENSANGTFVGTVSATNPTGVPAGTPVFYSITGGNSDGAFTIDPNSGDITVAGPIDFEATSQYTLTVLAGNSYGQSTTTVTINVQNVDEDPVFVNGQFNFNVQETAAIGTVVGTVVATNPNGVPQNTPIFYTIVAGNDAGDFTIDPTTGEISVANALNFEATPQYTLTVLASNSLGFDTVTVVINVQDVLNA
ncbi:MAG: cadherin repeat domain-containing protein [Planctomycetota bacterium]|nr:MAG: cadherin repeat domain-containing protein [Planctomycetota bacterium]